MIQFTKIPVSEITNRTNNEDMVAAVRTCVKVTWGLFQLGLGLGLGLAKGTWALFHGSSQR